MASTALEEKINKIRLKNEEIRRRHEEVEADKQNAAKLNALVKMVPTTDWPERKEPPEFSNPPPPKSNSNFKQKTSGKEYRGGHQQYHAGGGDGKKTHVFAEGDGPPPDPSYNFLADSERDERNREDLRNNDRFRGHGGTHRGAFRRRGSGRDGHSKEYRTSSTAPKDATKPEYEAWRAERNRIDEARISRQRTAEGNWRREWDNNKTNVEEDKADGTKATRQDIGDIVRKDHKEFDKWQGNDTDFDSPRTRGGKQYHNRGLSRGSHTNRGYQHSISYEQYHAPVSPSVIKPVLSPNGIDDRTVLATDKSIKVIVNHGNIAPKGPVMSVKVSSSSIAGTGRVGPRQKPRVLYSSQSETETPGHEFSDHKSPEDKANHVYFNQDVDEQSHYLSKTSHPQRRGENNSKSPYLPRKESKYDSQQRKHGEIASKSPYLQRKEMKDCPKSPQFQKKEVSHVKQRNNFAANDSFKSTNLQRRTADKFKYDTQKSPTTKKSDEISTSKPQRVNKRVDKLKNSQPKNFKKEQQPESNTQINTSVISEIIENVTESIDAYDGIEITTNECEANSSEGSQKVETIKEEESKSIGNAEVISISTCSGNADDSGFNDLKIIESSDLAETPESRVVISANGRQSPQFTVALYNGLDTELNVNNEKSKSSTDSVVLHSIENQSDSGSTNVVEISEGGVSMPQEIIEIEKFTENNVSDATDESKNISDISDVNSKYHENATLVTIAAKLESSETNVSLNNELRSESHNEISDNTDQQTNVILPALGEVNIDSHLSTKTESQDQ